jgi:hypothetical protein
MSPDNHNSKRRKFMTTNAIIRLLVDPPADPAIPGTAGNSPDQANAGTNGGYEPPKSTPKKGTCTGSTNGQHGTNATSGGLGNSGAVGVPGHILSMNIHTFEGTGPMTVWSTGGQGQQGGAGGAGGTGGEGGNAGQMSLNAMTNCLQGGTGGKISCPAASGGTGGKGGTGGNAGSGGPGGNSGTITLQYTVNNGPKLDEANFHSLGGLGGAAGPAGVLGAGGQGGLNEITGDGEDPSHADAGNDGIVGEAGTAGEPGRTIPDAVIIVQNGGS